MQKRSSNSRFTQWDVLIFGAGIAGLGAAIALAKKGRRVLVVSRRGLEGEASPRAAGIMNPVLGLNDKSPLLPLTLKAFACFPAWIRELEKATGSDVEFEKPGVLYAATTSSEVTELHRRFEWQKKLGLELRFLKGSSLRKQFRGLSPEVHAGLYYPTVSRIHPVKMMTAVRSYAARLGVGFQSSSRLIRMSRDLQGLFSVTLEGRRHIARQAVNAAGSWSADAALFGARLPVQPARGQIYILKGRLRPQAILHSMREGYLVPWRNGLFLAGSTVEFVGHHARVTQQGRKAILGDIERIFPGVREMKVLRSWAGLRPFSAVQKPILGPHPDIANLFLATGYFRSGILLGSYLGELLAKGMVEGNMPPEAAGLNPRRSLRKKLVRAG